MPSRASPRPCVRSAPSGGVSGGRQPFRQLDRDALGAGQVHRLAVTVGGEEALALAATLAGPDGEQMLRNFLASEFRPEFAYEDTPMGRVHQPTNMVQWNITQGEGMLMSHVVEATYVNGMLKLEQPLPFKDQEKVRVTVDRLTAAGHSVMDIEPVRLGQVNRALSADDDLRGEMLEGG